jgi:predicted ferric reductase
MLHNSWLKIYIWTLSIVGISAWIYKSLLFDLVKKKFQYQVIAINRLSDKVMEIELCPQSNGLSFVPGQFCFFNFQAPNISNESHPYTIIRENENGNLFIIVKSLGDYTHLLYKNLQAGAVAFVEGPYGRFDYRKGTNNQTWIGGGVGIAPFIGWANDLLKHPQQDLKVDLYYCVNHLSEATHTSVFDELHQAMPSFQVQVICKDVQGFVKMHTIKDIETTDLFICGPKEMRKALLVESNILPIKRKNIHYEDFDFV